MTQAKKEKGKSEIIGLSNRSKINTKTEQYRPFFLYNRPHDYESCALYYLNTLV